MNIFYYLFDFESEAYDARNLLLEKKVSHGKLRESYHHAKLSRATFDKFPSDVKIMLLKLNAGEISAVFQSFQGHFLCYRK